MTSDWEEGIGFTNKQAKSRAILIVEEALGAATN